MKQNYALYPHMSVYQNMAYGLKIRRMPKEEIDRRVRNAARILELDALLERKPRQLSGGQRQRVAMGRCIVREPKVFLFDEPLSNLDAKLRVQMRLEIRKLHEDLRITSIYVTHDQVEAMTLGDRLVVMEGGRAAQIGSPLTIYERPDNRFVAGFIGSPAMNFIDAVVSDDGLRLLLEGGGQIPAPPPGLAAHSGRKLVVGIRPEHFQLRDPSAECLLLTVNHVELLGADSLVHGHIGGGGAALTVRLAGLQAAAKNSTLALFAPPERLHLFDPDSGRRVDLSNP